MTWLDTVIVAVIALSTLLSLFRGVVKEVLSLAVWVLSFWLAFRYSYPASGLFEGVVLYDGADRCCSTAARTPRASPPASGRLYLRKGRGLVRDVFHSATCSTCAATSASAMCAIPRPAATLPPRRSRSTSTRPTASPRAQRQPDQRRRAQAEVFARGPAPHQHRSDSEVLLNVFAHELQSAARCRIDAGRHLRGRRRRAPALPRRLCGGGDDHRPRHRRLPRSRTASARWCSASARPTRAPSTCSPPRAWRSTMLGFELVRDVAPGEAVFIDERGRCTPSQCAPTIRAHALHLRVRLLRAAGFHHRQHLGATRPACAWARSWPRRSSASARTTTSTS
jgi:hypothetical protein